MYFVILANETEDAHLYWVASCEKYNAIFRVVELIKNNWISEIKKSTNSFFLACPSSSLSYFKTLYDERIYIISKVMGLPVYPSYEEIVIHENKKMLSYWLQANNLPHPKTFIFYNKTDSTRYIRNSEPPFVSKINIGASGHGVDIFRKKSDAINYIHRAFSNIGLTPKTGPNLNMGMWGSRIKNVIFDPSYIFKRISKYKQIGNDTQKHFVIFQEYTLHSFEWRIVKIGKSYFGHQKVKQGDKASGTKGIDYIVPPEDLLFFVKDLCEKYSFNCMAVDLFEDGDGGYLINEMQTVFGHVQSYICSKNGKPGRFCFTNGKWVFEEGMFNTNLSYDLRLENVFEMLENIESTFCK